MKIKFSVHAIKRIKERNIAKKTVLEAITNPDKVEISNAKENRFLMKKIYFNKNSKKDHLLLIIYEKEGGILTIITVIDTSKISKHF